MNKPKFTPGPWYIQTMPNDNFSWVKSDYNSVVHYGTDILAEDHGEHNGYPHEQYMADARLVSKAPEMYDYIFNVMGVLKTIYDGRSSFAPMIEDYINKAQELLKEINEEKS